MQLNLQQKNITSQCLAMAQSHLPGYVLRSSGSKDCKAPALHTTLQMLLQHVTTAIARSLTDSVVGPMYQPNALTLGSATTAVTITLTEGMSIPLAAGFQTQPCMLCCRVHVHLG